MRRTSRVIVAASFAAVSIPSVVWGAASHTWTGGFPFGPDSMNASVNWFGGTGVPVSGETDLTLFFPGGASSFTPNQDIVPVLSLQSLNVLSGSYTFSGGGYAFTNLGAAPTISTPNNVVTFNSALSFATTTTWTMNAPVNLNGQLSGSGDINVTAGANAHVIIGGGLSNSYAGTLTMGNGTITLQKPGGGAMPGRLNLSNMFLNVNAANQFGIAAAVTLNNSTMNVGTAQTLFDLRLDNGSTVNISGSPTITINGTIRSTSGYNSLGNNASQKLDFGGALRQINVTSVPGDLLSINTSIVNGRFIKTGGGILQLFSGASSYTGQNVVSGGSVWGNADSFGTILNNANIRLFSGVLAANTISGIGSVTIDGAIGYAGPQTYTGGTALANSSLLYGDANALLGAIDCPGVGNSATLFIQQPANGTFNATLSGNISVSKSLAGVLAIGGTNTHTGLNFFTDGGVNILSDTAFGSGTLLLGNTATTFTVEATGNRVVTNPLIPPGILEFIGGGSVRFSDPAAKQFNLPITQNSTGTTTIDGKLTMTSGAVVTVNSGTLIVGNPAVVNAFTSAAPIVVNGGTLVVRGLNFTTLNDVTLAGGAIYAPSGYAIPLGAALQGFGGVTGRVASANGSSIIASGSLNIGDAAHPAGVNLDGELYTAANTVTLLDSNQAVLGSFTQIGDGVNNGTIAAANGVVLEFGRNIVGRGKISGTNTLAKASIINGSVNGDSITNFIEFTGYVKGVGNFDNVAFSGTFAPGLSPTLLTVGNVVLTPSSVLEIEIGGLNRGSDYDAFNITGTMALDGQLRFTFINSFVPGVGNQFDIFDGATTGTFASFDFPTLTAGLTWDTSQLYSTGVVQVVVIPEPHSLLAPTLLAVFARRRRGLAR